MSLNVIIYIDIAFIPIINPLTFVYDPLYGITIKTNTTKFNLFNDIELHSCTKLQLPTINNISTDYGIFVDIPQCTTQSLLVR